MRKNTLFFLLCLIATSLTACNTVQGFGKDMQAGGQNLEQAAQDSK